MLKKLTCKHCVGLFQPIRTGNYYCSDTCRKLAFKSKTKAKTQAKRNRKLSEKLKKLANSAFGIYLVKELRRAGTAEILSIT
jgi:predicted nucleic acid-binding Zn ribbon protein